MPQLDKLTYFTQFFWSCLFFLTFYIPICNDGDGVLGISRILKLRNQLVSHRGNKIRSKDPNSLEDILRKGLSTGVSYMYSSLFEVSQWCNEAVDLLGKRGQQKTTFLSCFGEISLSRDPSPWPISGSLGALATTVGGVMYMHSFQGGARLISLGLIFLLYTMFVWWRDVLRESTLEGHHTKVVQLGLRYGFILFIVSEVMFLFAFFRASSHSSLAPTVEIGGIWPPKGIGVLDPREIPFLNTLILLSSGAAVTWAHHAILAGKEKRAVYALVATVSLADVFTGFQGMEYYQAPFTISDSIYGSTFFLATGFHGFHVIIGTLFLIICGIRQYLGHLTKEHHVGFEAAAWYWHFVDVVRLFLFVSIYWWGGKTALLCGPGSEGNELVSPLLFLICVRSALRARLALCLFSPLILHWTVRMDFAVLSQLKWKRLSHIEMSIRFLPPMRWGISNPLSISSLALNLSESRPGSRRSNNRRGAPQYTIARSNWESYSIRPKANFNSPNQGSSRVVIVDSYKGVDV
ncbi:putative ATP synthase protein YMF19, partial [Cucurbita argyrosperma subsp. sororia]